MKKTPNIFIFTTIFLVIAIISIFLWNKCENTPLFTSDPEYIFVDPQTIDNIDGGLGRRGRDVGYWWYTSEKLLPAPLQPGDTLIFTNIPTQLTETCIFTEHPIELSYFCQVPWKQKLSPSEYGKKENYVINKIIQP